VELVSKYVVMTGTVAVASKFPAFAVLLLLAV